MLSHTTTDPMTARDVIDPEHHPKGMRAIR
jgi:hypothetical protein